MFGSILPRPTADFLLMSDPAGDAGGSGGGSGGSGGDPAGGTTPPTPSGVPQSKVDEIVSQRVGETKRKTEEEIAKQLGVPIDEAKRLIAEAKKRDDAEKSEAQRAKEAADAERAAAEAEKGESTQAKHAAQVEREILRHVKMTDDKGKPLDDAVIDTKVARIARLVDVEIGAEPDAIKAAVKALKDDEPTLFGNVQSGSGGTPPPPGDPEGTPPKPTGAEGAFDKGKQRAKAQPGAGGYPILEGSGSAPAST